MEHINCVKYRAYRGEEIETVYLFYSNGMKWQDNRGLTLKEAEAVYPKTEYTWNMVNNKNV